MSAGVSAVCSWYSEDRHHVYVISKCLLHCQHPQVDPRWQLVRDAENRLRIKRRMRTKNFVKVESSVLQACCKHLKGYSTCVLSPLLQSSTLQFYLTEDGACALRRYWGPYSQPFKQPVLGETAACDHQCQLCCGAGPGSPAPCG